MSLPKEITPDIFGRLAADVGFTSAEQYLAAMTLVTEAYSPPDLLPRVLSDPLEPGVLNTIGSNVKRFFDRALTSAAMRNYYEPDFDICSTGTLDELRKMFTAARDYDQRGLVLELPRY